MNPTRRSVALLLASAAFFKPLLAKAANAIKGAAADGPVALPKNIVWETNNDDPIIGSEKAILGGTLNLLLDGYPLTFRVMGPNSNDYYAAWNQQFALQAVVGMHPDTDKFIPNLATHWSVQPDQKTIFYKLDPDARWSDGKSITASDYVFALEMMRSKFILDPFQNTYAKEYFASIDRVDDYTIRVVGTRPSWRPLYDYSPYPMPAHAIMLDKDWVTRTNSQWLVVPGPYVVSEVDLGQSVTFSRVANWWGDKKRYNIGQYNFDKIKLHVLPRERQLDFVRSGQLDMMEEGQVQNWHQIYDFPAVNNGWLRRARIFCDMPQGISGLHMNMESPIFANRDFRLAMQYLVDFNRLNRDLWYGDYYRLNSFFEGTQFANPAVKAYPFDPVKAREHLALAGYKRPSDMTNRGWLASIKNVAYGLLFTRSDQDDILVNAEGEKASFTLIYGTKTWEQALTVMQQDFRRAGVEMKLQLLEGSTQFERLLERKFEMGLEAMTSGIYPDPRQYLGTEFKNSKNNNDFWGFGTQQVDDLIATYEHSMDAEARKLALYQVDQIVHDQAFYIPLRTVPYLDMVYWDYIQFPDFWLPKRTLQFSDWLVYWIDPEKKAALTEAMKNNTPYPVDRDIDKDYFHVKDKYKA